MTEREANNIGRAMFTILVLLLVWWLIQVFDAQIFSDGSYIITMKNLGNRIVGCLHFATCNHP